MRKLCYLLLTCDDNEKEKIANHLLEKRLVVCAKFIPVNAMYRWHGEVANENEVALLMESAEDLFDEIELEVRKVHSFDTFVLTQLPLSNINQSARSWMQQELKSAR